MRATRHNAGLIAPLHFHGASRRHHKIHIVRMAGHDGRGDILPLSHPSRRELVVSKSDFLLMGQLSMLICYRLDLYVHN